MRSRAVFSRPQQTAEKNGTNGFDLKSPKKIGVTSNGADYNALLTDADAAKRQFVAYMGRRYSVAGLELHLRQHLRHCGYHLSPDIIDQVLRDCRSNESVGAILLRRSLRGNKEGNAPILDVLRGKVVRGLTDTFAKDYCAALQLFLQKSYSQDEPDWPVQPPNIDQERARFADALIAAILARLHADSTLQQSSWDSENIRSYAIQQAVHGAIEHLCVRFAEALAPAALIRAEQEKEKKESSGATSQKKRGLQW